MLKELLHALIESHNEAADDVLVEALQLGNAQEKRLVLATILRRKAVKSLCGAVAAYDRLPESLQIELLSQIKVFHPALREAGRSDDIDLRLAALKLIALGRQGKLAYVLSENLHDSSAVISKAATEALVALAKWASTETRRLQKGQWAVAPSAAASADSSEKSAPAPAAASPENKPTASAVASAAARDAAAPATRAQAKAADGKAASADAGSAAPLSPPVAADVTPAALSKAAAASYAELMIQRPEIEAAVARALDVHRGKHGPDLLRAALLICDWPGSKTLAILHTAKHGGQSPMVRRLQQPPASEFVEAFLLGASHGQLRSHFGIAFSHINEAPVLDALLRKTHWLCDQQLQLCMHHVTRAAWLNPAELQRDIERRTPEDAARVGEWIAVSGAHESAQDERLEKLVTHCSRSFDGRLRILRVVARRKRGDSVQFLKIFLSDPDERLVRLAAREIIRRKPLDYENMLLQLMVAAPESVRRVVSRAIGQAGFDNYWLRFDKLDRPTRKQAGRAMLKLLPDAPQRLRRRLVSGAPEHRIKAMQMAQELGLADDLADAIVSLCSDGNPRIRSKAITALGGLTKMPAEVVIDRLITDNDSRVRANAIEVLEKNPEANLLPVLLQRAMASNNRERANAIKALHRMKVKTASMQLLQMLRDPRPEHRISALWALWQIGWWQMLTEVGRLAKEDANIKVRRYAVGVLKSVAEVARQQNQKEAG